MLSWLRRRRVRTDGIEAEAEALIHELGVKADSAARQREHEASSDAVAKYWSRVGLAIAAKTGKRVALDTSTRIAMNAASAPDREPATARERQAYSKLVQIRELTRILGPRPEAFRIQFVGAMPDRRPTTLKEVEIQVADVSSAIIAAANLAWPAQTTGVRIIDRKGHEVFSRQQADRH
jgi:hypothetical protein